MITTLHIKNIGIIDDLNVDFNQGLNVLTGETGAGKTLMIGSLAIIAGGRFSKEMIRKGEDHSFVEICFYLPKHENAVDGNIIVSREIYTNGRNFCKINGRMVTVTELKKFMSTILNIHGQNDNQNLLNTQMHIVYLDAFAEKELAVVKHEYRELFEEYNNLKFELKSNYGDDKEKQRKLDLLRYQDKEIKEARLKEKEDEELEEQKRRIQNAEKLSENLKEADLQIGENAVDAISQAIRNLEKIESLDSSYEVTLNNLKSSYYDLQEIARDINSYQEDICFDEEQREEIETRLDIIFSLKRKYGNSIEEILHYQQEVEQEIQIIENLEEYTSKIKKQLVVIEKKMEELAKKMHEIRTEYARKLSENINMELQDLEMKSANFNIKVEMSQIKEFNKNGLDNVEFLILTNKGEEEKPLIKIASGGEMSRIMLAIKTVLSHVDQVPVLVFDEIDTGISGQAAKAVGEKLKTISKQHQVLIVTHLASIAAKGEYNYYIYKEVDKDKTRTKVKLLQGDEVVKEIARIASGDITEISLKHAIELREAI